MPLQRLEIPAQTNFKSIPSLNLVGGQAETEFFQQVASEAADVNRTAKKIIDDEARVRGKQQGLEAGVKGDLSQVNGETGPYSGAYNDAAVAAYIDSQGNSINEKLSAIEGKNPYNPQAFAEESQKLISGAMAETPSVAAAQLKITADTLAASRYKEISLRTGKRNADMLEKEIYTGIENNLNRGALARANGNMEEAALADAQAIKLTTALAKSGLVSEEVLPYVADNIAFQRDRLTNIALIAKSGNPAAVAATMNNLSTQDLSQAFGAASQRENMRQQQRSLAEQGAGRAADNQAASLFERAKRGEDITVELDQLTKRKIALGQSPSSAIAESNSLKKISLGEADDIPTNWSKYGEIEALAETNPRAAKDAFEANRHLINPKDAVKLQNIVIAADLLPENSAVYKAANNEIKRAFPLLQDGGGDQVQKIERGLFNEGSANQRRAAMAMFEDLAKKTGSPEEALRQLRPQLEAMSKVTNSTKSLMFKNMAFYDADETIRIMTAPGKQLKNAARQPVMIQYSRAAVVDEKTARDFKIVANKTRAQYEGLGGNLSELERMYPELSKNNIVNVMEVWSILDE